ncbi:MAG: tRNA (N6-isopentenyl adenosine(37)-C2)-methylthiotransferase MiaB [Paracoccaceae bacterium]
MSKAKKLFVKTYGCQMNVYDSERMVETMSEQGYDVTDTADNADMILLNTCHIREKAAEKVYSELGRFKQLKDEKPNLKVAVAGCVAQAEGQEIMRRQPLVDMVVGPQSYHRLAELEQQAAQHGRALDIDFPVEDKFTHLTKRVKLKRGPSAFLTVQEGCDKFCAFCVVPYTRGAEVSRSVQQIMDEASSLIDQGVCEITLLGQNVNGYHGVDEKGKAASLAELIWRLNDLKGLERIRFTTSHPNDMTPDLIDAHGSCQKLMPYLHLPVQSGSNRILKRMNRSHTAEQYIEVIEKLRAARPDLLLSGDFIVGFPEETDADFQATLDLITEVNYGQAYSFKYSTRPGTPAAERDQVEEHIKTERLHVLQALLSEQQKRLQASMVSKTVQVLFEKSGRFDGQLVGKSQYLHAVHVEADTSLIGSVCDVRITQSNSHSLNGELLK